MKPRFVAKPDPSPDHEGDWVIFDTQGDRVAGYGYDSKEQAEANFPQSLKNDPATR